MNKVLGILFLPVLVINVVAAVLLVCCAYSPILPAGQFPLLSLAGLAFPFALALTGAFLLFWLFAYRRYIWFTLITILVCLPQIRAFFPVNFDRQRPPENSLKVLSYNILGPNIGPWNANKDNAIIAYIEAADADIICLQELNFASLKKQKGLLEKYPYKSYNVSDEIPSKAHYLGCLSKYPILSVEQLDLNSDFNGCTKYRIRHGKDTIVVYNCHLQSNGLNREHKDTYEQLLTNPKEYLRSEGTKVLIKKLRDSAAKRATKTDVIVADIEEESSPYIIVCGDFNDSPISYTCYQLRKQLTDAYVKSGNGPGISYNRNRLYYRIDHIMHSDQFKAYRCTVDRSIKVSDHYPIYCFLTKE